MLQSLRLKPNFEAIYGSKEQNRFTNDPPIPIEFTPTQKLLNLIANLAPDHLQQAAIEADLLLTGEEDDVLFPARLITKAQQEGKEILLWDAAAMFTENPSVNLFHE